MKKLLFITLITVLISCSGCSKKNDCSETVDVVVTSNTTINKIVATHSPGMGMARFTDSALEFNAIVGSTFKLQSVHEKDTVMTIDVNGRKYEIEAMQTIEIPVLCP